MTRPYLARALALLSCLAGCNTAPPSSPPMTAAPLAAGGHCTHAGAPGRALWIGDAAELLEAYKTVDGQRLGAAPGPRPEPDFARYGAVIVFMGRQPTAGYALTPGYPLFSIEDKTAVLRLVYESPAQNSLRAQVVTSPCIVVSVPRGGYSTLQVIDQHGAPRHRLTVNNDQ